MFSRLVKNCAVYYGEGCHLSSYDIVKKLYIHRLAEGFKSLAKMTGKSSMLHEVT